MAKLAIDKIVLDLTLYPRSGISEFNVSRLLAALKSGARLPPLIVERRTHRLVDGRHRLEAYKRAKLKTIEVAEKVYTNDADLFADAVRCNVGHGEPLDHFSIRNAIIRLTEYGYTRDAITEVVRMPADRLEKIERGFAIEASSGKPLALKGGLSHLAGQRLTPDQVQANRSHSGGKAIFYVRQLISLMQNDLVPPSEAFAIEMDRLLAIWREAKQQSAA
jgi:hypothetical protein